MKKHFIAHDATESLLNAQDAELARSLLVKVRSTAACSNCAQTKTKCDNDVKQPCSRCRSKGLTCAARTTRPRGPKPKQPRPSQNKTPVDASADGADNSRSGNDGSESPSASCSMDKESLSTASTDGEPGPSINVAATMAPTTPPWNMSSDFSCLAQFDMDPSHSISGTQQQMSPAMAKMQNDAQAAPNIQQAVPMDQETVFSQDLLYAMGSNNDGPAIYGPSWDLGNSPDQFFNPASEVFGPFLGFPSPENFGPDAPVVTNPGNAGEDVVMREPEAPPAGQESYPALQSQQRPGLRLDNGNDINSNNNDDGKAIAIQTTRADTTSALAPENDPAHGESSVNDPTDPWILPKDVEHWNMLQCSPKPSTVAPGRAIANLAFLEESSRHSSGPWSARGPGSSETTGQFSSGPFTHINVSLLPVTREKISAITQSFFPKALEIHGLGVTSSPSSHRPASAWFGSSGYILLPPTQDLEVFLENYMNFVEPYFPLVPTRTLDPNELLVASGNEKGATLLLLLMIAIGATRDPATKARRFGAGLAEMCRISLTDLVEKDNEYSTVPLILQCSLLLTIQSCWGGDKWQMDIGAGHRFMYIAVSS